MVNMVDSPVERKKYEILKNMNLVPIDVADLKKLNATWFYIKNESNLKFLFCCFKNSASEEKEKKIIARGSSQLKEDFNYKNVVDRLRLSQFETSKLIRKNLIQYIDFETDHILTIFNGQEGGGQSNKFKND